MSKKNEKKNSERDFTKIVKDLAERLNVNKSSDPDVEALFKTIHSALNHLANLASFTFTVEENFNIGEVMHAMIASTLVHALMRTSPEWLKGNLQFTLDNFDDLEGIANDLLESGQMEKGDTEDFAEFVEAYRGKDSDRVVH